MVTVPSTWLTVAAGLLSKNWNEAAFGMQFLPGEV